MPGARGKLDYALRFCADNQPEGAHHMLKVWGRANSINVQKVLWICGELNVPFERTDAGLQFGVNNTPEFKAKNPNALVPLIDDAGFLLWESQAIVRYLARKHGLGTVCPSDAKACATTIPTTWSPTRIAASCGSAR